MPAVTRTEVHDAGYACDMCGVLISDGNDDGYGGQSFWGLNMEAQELNEEEITTVHTRNWMGDTFRVTVREKDDSFPKVRQCWGLCRKCYQKVEDFILR